MIEFRQHSARGMTLIELMIVIVVIAVLAGVAFPSYINSVRKARRSDGMAAVTQIQLAQEKLRASCPFYAQNLGGAANACGANAAASTIQAPTTSTEGWYTLTLTNAGPLGYTATATGTGDQADDSVGGVACTLVLTVNAANPDGLRTPATCWNR